MKEALSWAQSGAVRSGVATLIVGLMVDLTTRVLREESLLLIAMTGIEGIVIYG